MIIVNKADLFGKKEAQQFADWKEMYESIHYNILLMSINRNEGIDEVKDLLKQKTTLVSGPSGVGKSSFVNSVFPDKYQKTQDVSGWSGKGLHTTSFAEMFDLPAGGQLIDTPGIREFGLVDISKQELCHYFPEMRDLLQDCQFNNCLHTDEPGCAIKKALEEGEIFADRYISYRKILDTIGEDVH
jgi:ribosome biogenesis GTPase